LTFSSQRRPFCLFFGQKCHSLIFGKTTGAVEWLRGNIQLLGTGEELLVGGQQNKGLLRQNAQKRSGFFHSENDVSSLVATGHVIGGQERCWAQSEPRPLFHWWQHSGGRCLISENCFVPAMVPSQFLVIFTT
jgi:hypothetical protein